MTSHVLLLTDIVDSTKLTEHLGDAAMAALWTRHDRLARDLLVHHDGKEIDRTDGFLLLFPAVAAAVAYGLAYHRAIRPLELVARVGIHVGSVVLLENSAADRARGAKPAEIEGLAKPVAARVMALAQGGQTLLTADARAVLGGTSLRVESHGHWRVKGVAEPMEIFEVGGADAPFAPPPDGEKAYRVVLDGDHWLPVKAVRHNLPHERDVFVGRDADLQVLAGRLDEGASLVTVLGMGGSGKTRLVTRYGWSWLGDWPGGVWFCGLSEARGIDGICYAVAGALDVPLGKDDPVTQLGHAIAGRGSCLVVLDNFEQVARFAPDTLGNWLDRAPEAQFVVTTREVLGLSGETTVALAPLPAVDAAALFVARAVQAKHDFTLSEADRPQVAALVRVLDGLPLAIELAAARVRLMPPGALLQRMSERFKVLASSGGRHTRQATLRATLDWSWDLLSSDEQEALAQLSVFEGGFTLEAAEAVLSLPALWPADAVQALVDQSWVRRVGEDRMDLLLSVKEYAAEKLELRGGRETVEGRHGAHFATLGSEEALEALHVHGGAARRRALGSDLDNLVAACRRAAARADCAVATGTLAAAWEVLERRGPIEAAVRLATEVVALLDGDRKGRSVAEGMLGLALLEFGNPTPAVAHLEAALGCFRDVGDRSGEAAVRVGLGSEAAARGKREEALCHCDAALALARAGGGGRRERLAIRIIGVVSSEFGRFQEARTHFACVLELCRAVGDDGAAGLVLGNLGVLASRRGRLADAREHCQAALVLHMSEGDRSSVASCLCNLGMLDMMQGEWEWAREHLEAALAQAREMGGRRVEGVVRTNLGELHHAQGQWELAHEHLDAALALHQATQFRRWEGSTRGQLGDLCRAQGRWDTAREHLEAALGLQFAVEDRRGEGGTLRCLGLLCLEQGRLPEARAHLEASEALLRVVDVPYPLGRLLAARARLERAEGHSEAARTTLAEAESIAAAVGVGPQSPLGSDIAKARAALDGA